MGHELITATASRKSRIAAPLAALGAALLLAFGLSLAQTDSAAAGLTDSSRAAPSSSAKLLPAENQASERIIVAEPWDKGWKKKGWNKGPGKWNKGWGGPNKIVVRPYRRWYKRPHYGRIIGGIALGTILGAAAYSAMAPAPGLCWYWADPYRTRGYWDYCY